MLVVMKHGAKPAEVEAVVRVIEEMGYEARPMPGAQRTAVGLVGNDGRVDASRIEALSGVAQVIHVTQPYKQVSREWKAESTIVSIGGTVHVGGSEVPIIAGPCSVESEEQIVTAARMVKAAGASALRGGAFKPRSSPYSFQGLGKKGLELLAIARRETGLAIVTEAMDEEGAELVAEYGDCIQIGARNMQNYSLLKFCGKLGKPVLLKRGLAATIQELLLSAEYVLASGNPNVILCERGVRTFDTIARNMFDLTAIPIVQQMSHLPIIADPSHGTGHPRQGDPDGTRRDRGRGERRDGGSASESRARAVGRRAVAVSGAIRAAGGRIARDRGGDRPHDHARAGARGRGGGQVRIAAAGAALALAAAVCAARGQTATATLERAAAVYSNMKTARVTFTQTVDNPLTGHGVDSKGEMLQRLPGRYAVSFTQPAGDRIVSDGKAVWIYLPSTNPGQVIKMTVGDGSANIPDFTTWLLDSPAQRFTITDGGAATVGGHATHIVGLTPKSRGAPFTFAKLWIDDADGIVRQFETKDANGSVRRVRVDAIEMNVTVSDGAFVFTLPPGVRVFDQGTAN